MSDAHVTFEAGMAKLEQALTKLERGDLDLEQALATFEEGMRWSQFCQNRLASAEQRVLKLIDPAGTTPSAAPSQALFALESETKDEPPPA